MLTDAFDDTLEEDSTDMETDDTPAAGAWTLRPASTEVEGPLKGIVELEDQDYELEAEDLMGDSTYVLNLKFKVLQPQKFDKTVTLYGVLYDEAGNPVVMDMKQTALAEDSETFRQERPLECFSAGYLQMAISKGEECTKTSLLLRFGWYPKFAEGKDKIKTFKVFSKLEDYGGFDYDNELYQ